MRDCPSYNPKWLPALQQHYGKTLRTPRLTARISRVRLTEGQQQRFPSQQPILEKKNNEHETTTITARCEDAPLPFAPSPP